MDEVVPTILTADISDFSKKVEKLKGICSRVQVDIIDSIFAPNKTVDLAEIRENIDFSGLKIDLHLMVGEPLGWISRALEIVPDRIIAHVENMSDPWAFINEVIESGTQVGLAVDLDTPLEKVSDDIYLMADLVMLLGVKAGKGGQIFDNLVLEKLERLRKILGDLPAGGEKIGIDGGVNKDNIKLCKKSGANIFYIGSDFWQAQDLKLHYNELLRVISN